MSSALAGIRKSPAAPLLPGHAGHGLVGFQLCGLSVVCGLCRASILAGLAGMQGYASPLRSPGPSFPSAVIFRSFTRSDFAVSPSNSRQPCASGCGFPCALCIPALSPGFYGGTAPPGAAEHVTMEDSGMSVVGKRLVRTVLIFTESSDQLSRATDRVPGLPASPGYVQ